MSHLVSALFTINPTVDPLGALIDDTLVMVGKMNAKNRESQRQENRWLDQLNQELKAQLDASREETNKLAKEMGVSFPPDIESAGSSAESSPRDATIEVASFDGLGEDDFVYVPSRRESDAKDSSKSQEQKKDEKKKDGEIKVDQQPKGDGHPPSDPPADSNSAKGPKGT